MQDAIVGSPYFYFSAYGLNGSPITVAAMEPLQDGHWVDQDWKGAVLPLDGIHRNTLDRFILEVVKHYVLTTDGGPS